MGTTAHVVVVTPDAALADRALALATGRLGRLEAKWSRFRPDSEIARLNAVAGRPAVVSAETRTLVSRAVEGWERTDGRFDPTVHDALVALGYDRDFRTLGAAPVSAAATGGAPGCAAVELDPFIGTVRFPAGVHFDAGGIGKGLAADLVAEEVLATGVDGVCVNVGGDLRVLGDSPAGPGWTIEIEHPVTGDVIDCVTLREGAVVTTCRTRRVWGPDDDRRHHLLDPRTGRSAQSGLAGVTVVAGHAWWAEVLAKAAFVAGPGAGAELVGREGASGYLVLDDGSVRLAGRIEEFVA